MGMPACFSRVAVLLSRCITYHMLYTSLYTTKLTSQIRETENPKSFQGFSQPPSDPEQRSLRMSLSISPEPGYQRQGSAAAPSWGQSRQASVEWVGTGRGESLLRCWWTGAWVCCSLCQCSAHLSWKGAHRFVSECAQNHGQHWKLPQLIHVPSISCLWRAGQSDAGEVEN